MLYMIMIQVILVMMLLDASRASYTLVILGMLMMMVVLTAD